MERFSWSVLDACQKYGLGCNTRNAISETRGKKKTQNAAKEREEGEAFEEINDRDEMMCW